MRYAHPPLSGLGAALCLPPCFAPSVRNRRLPRYRLQAYCSLGFRLASSRTVDARLRPFGFRGALCAMCSQFAIVARLLARSRSLLTGPRPHFIPRRGRSAPPPSDGRLIHSATLLPHYTQTEQKSCLLCKKTTSSATWKVVFYAVFRKFCTVSYRFKACNATISATRSVAWKRAVPSTSTSTPACTNCGALSSETPPST